MAYKMALLFISTILQSLSNLHGTIKWDTTRESISTTKVLLLQENKNGPKIVPCGTLFITHCLINRLAINMFTHQLI